MYLCLTLGIRNIITEEDSEIINVMNKKSEMDWKILNQLNWLKEVALGFELAKFYHVRRSGKTDWRIGSWLSRFQPSS